MAAARNHTSLIQYKQMSFLITDRPTDNTIDNYLEVRRRALRLSCGVCVMYECPAKEGLAGV
jgi:hypothetical protein